MSVNDWVDLGPARISVGERVFGIARLEQERDTGALRATFTHLNHTSVAAVLEKFYYSSGSQPQVYLRLGSQLYRVAIVALNGGTFRRDRSVESTFGLQIEETSAAAASSLRHTLAARRARIELQSPPALPKESTP